MISDFLDSFPSLPGCSGKWTPVYLEPIIQSGELITIAIAASTDKGEYTVRGTLNDRQLSSLYGNRAADIKELISIIHKSLETYLKVNGDITDWTPPFNGITTGETRRAADDDINGIITQGMERCASLYQLMTKAQSKEPTLKQQQQRWRNNIKSSLQNIRPELVEGFDEECSPYKGMYLDIDFATPKLVAGLIQLPNGKGTTEAGKIAKIKLYDLMVARDKQLDTTLDARFEIILGVNPWQAQPSKRFTEMLYNLRHQASKEEIKIYEQQSHNEIAEHIAGIAA